MTELREQINNIVEDYNACKVLAQSVGSSEVYEGTTATAEDIREGKTAYSNGELIEGVMESNSNNAMIGTSIVAGNSSGYSKIYSLVKELTGEFIGGGSYAFYECSSLERIEKLDTNGVTDMQYMFYGCSNLKTLPELNTSQVKNMLRTFYQCTSLTEIPELDTSQVTDMLNTFYSCSSLKTIPELNTSRVTRMSSMFGKCSSLKTLPLLDTSNVTDMYAMFNGCTNLTTVPILNTNAIISTGMGNIFANCANLSDDTLNNILVMCINAIKITSNKTLKYIGLTSAQATRCQSLSNYEAFTAAGWTTGY